MHRIRKNMDPSYRHEHISYLARAMTLCTLGVSPTTNRIALTEPDRTDPRHADVRGRATGWDSFDEAHPAGGVGRSEHTPEHGTIPVGGQLHATEATGPLSFRHQSPPRPRVIRSAR